MLAGRHLSKNLRCDPLRNKTDIFFRPCCKQVHLRSFPQMENGSGYIWMKRPLMVIGEQPTQVVCQSILYSWKVAKFQVDRVGDSEIPKQNCLLAQLHPSGYPLLVHVKYGCCNVMLVHVKPGCSVSTNKLSSQISTRNVMQAKYMAHNALTFICSCRSWADHRRCV